MLPQRLEDARQKSPTFLFFVQLCFRSKKYQLAPLAKGFAKTMVTYFLFCISFATSLSTNAQQKNAMDVWLTSPNDSIFFQQQKPIAFTATTTAATIMVDDRTSFQTIDGFGFALTGGSAGHLLQMSAAARKILLKELFSTKKNGIGTSYLRISIGASDLNETVFSYDDLPIGETDTALLKFNLGQDKKDVIPILKEILAINPTIKIMGSPWSPPSWIKTNNDTRGGSLKPAYYHVYANYFVKYIQAMQQEGIAIDAITVQNEPLHPGNNPSLLMLATEQAEFVKNHLGPAFHQAGIKTKIIIYDHNADKPEYPISILNDAAARKFVDGSAFHLYGGKIDALSKVHDAHPDKHLYFTEQWVGAPGNMKKDIADHIEKLIIGATRNWSRTVIEWNLSSNPSLKPYTSRGGCNKCLGAITISNDSVTRNPAYFTIAHASKFVRPNSLRMASNFVDGLDNVAFKNIDGKMVLIVLNTSTSKKTFLIGFNDKTAIATLAAGAVATYVWK